MNILNVKIDQLIAYETNARAHSDQQIIDLTNSIKKFGFNDPIECDKNFVIISGHARLEAAKKLGLSEVPAIIHDHLEENEKKAYILAANKIATNATWDTDLLKMELNYLNEIEFDLDSTGFHEDEINALLNLSNDFLPDSEDNQGKLDELEPKMTVCPHCGKEYDLRNT